MHQFFLKTLPLLLLIVYMPLQGQNISEMAGRWPGYVEMNNQEVRIEITFAYSDEVLDGTIDIPNRGTFSIPVEVVDTNNNQLVFQYETGNGPAVFYGSVNANGNKISGDFEESGEVFPFLLNKKTIANGVYTNLPESDILIPTSSGEIGGSLILQTDRSPLVILVSGSGGKDRNQDIGGFQIFHELSLNLYEDGYSSFRYDDPGIGESSGDMDVTLQEMSLALSDIIHYLKREYAESISGVILLGHNQGGLVASMAATESFVNGVVLAATPFVPGDENITQQIQKIADTNDLSEEIIQRNLVFQEKIYEVVKKEGDWKPIENELAERLRNQIEELPPEHQHALGDMSTFIQSQVDHQLETAKSHWFKSWIEMDPISIFEQLEVPVVAIFAEKDMQVLPRANIKHADSLNAVTDFHLETVTIPGANHLFQKANTGMPAEYGMLKNEFTADFILQIDQFVSSMQFKAPD